MTELAGGQLTARAAQIAAVLAKHGLKAVKEDEAARPARLRAALEELGPTFCKLGQMLSTRPDLIPPELADELASLQDRVPPLTEAEVVQVMEEELGVPWEDVFESIEPEPLAAGTIGQVHRARLEGGDAGGGQGPAAERRGRDRARPRPVRALRREGRGARGPLRPGRHPGRRRAPLGVAPPRARLPRGGGEHRADARGARPVPAARRPRVHDQLSSRRLLVMDEIRRRPRCATRRRATSAARPPGSCSRPSTARC